MPIVTAISRQRRNADRFSISVDGTYVFSLSDLDLSASNLRVGATLSTNEIEAWQRQSGEAKAYNQAVNYVSLRMRSASEIGVYLKRKGWDEDVITRILERLVSLGLVDDAAFAAAWVRERQLLRPRSVKALRFELMKHGVGRDDIDTALADNAPDEVQLIVELAQRRARQYPDRTKLMGYLARQGFGYDKIKAALKILDGE